MRKQTALLLVAIILSFTGCSRKDPPTNTPDYHIGTPTNRSSTNSWELHHEPLYTQPGVNSGAPVVTKAIPSQRGFEPNDPVAAAVLAALSDAGISTRYLTARAKDGVVILEGSVDKAAQKAQAAAVARAVPGVKKLDARLTAAAP